jgi:hypothetical protein
MNDTVPQTRPQTPNYSNYQPADELIKLRKRVNDLLRLGAATPETFAQTILQIFQETERHRQSSMEQAEEHLRKYHALVAQGQGFAMQSSILYSVINGYATIEERRALELAEREREKAQALADEEREKAEAAAAAEIKPKAKEAAASQGRRKS